MSRRILTAFLAGALTISGASAVDAHGNEPTGECGAGLQVTTFEHSRTGHDDQAISIHAGVDADCRFLLEGTITDPTPAIGLLYPARADLGVTIEDITDVTKGWYRYTITYRLDNVFVDHEPTTFLESASIAPSIEASATYGPNRRGPRASPGAPDEGTFTHVLDVYVNQDDHVHGTLDVRIGAQHRGGNAEFRIRGQVLSIQRTPLNR